MTIRAAWVLAGASFALGALLLGGCGAAADDGAQSAESAFATPKCSLGYVPNCTTTGGDPGDGVKHTTTTCACVRDDAATPDNTYPLKQVTDLPYDTNYIDTASSPGTFPASDFAYPSQLSGEGCTQTAMYRDRPDDTVGGRLWACPFHDDGTMYDVKKGVGATTCPPGFMSQIVEGTRAPSGDHIGTPIQGWYFLGEACWAPRHGDIGRSCNGPCMGG